MEFNDLFAFIDKPENLDKVKLWHDDYYRALQARLFNLLQNFQMEAALKGVTGRPKNFDWQTLTKLVERPHIAGVLQFDKIDVAQLHRMLLEEEKASVQYLPSCPISLDFQGPWIDRGIDVEEFDRASQEKITSQLVESFNLFRKLNPTACRFVEIFTKTVQIRKISSKRSYMTNHYPGRLFLGFPEAEMDLVNVIEMLYHETLHFVVSTYGNLGFFLKNRSSLTLEMNRFVRSPWNDALISVPDFFQAIYVWFGLWRLFLNASRLRALDPRFHRDTEHILHKSSFGFIRSQDLLRDVLNNRISEMDPIIVKMIDTMRDKVKKWHVERSLWQNSIFSELSNV